MKQTTAPTSLAIKAVTGFALALNAALYFGAFYQRQLLIPSLAVTAVVLVCYWFWTPVSYELAGGELIVSFRVGRKRYGPVLRCSAVDAPVRGGIRLFGNGGLFAGSGLFWSRKVGLFRAYVTTSKLGDLVWVETPRTKVLISPQDARGFLVAPP
jgi:hypothetical protein